VLLQRGEGRKREWIKMEKEERQPGFRKGNGNGRAEGKKNA